MPDPVRTARALAEQVLAPAAADVDRTGRLPRRLLDALAGAGLYGLTGPADAGGLAADPATVAAVVEELAAGDLATTFVWLQHLGAVRRVAASAPQPLRDAVLPDLCAGRLRAGVALQAALRPGPAAVTARRDRDVVVLDGAVPWVTGWGHVDLLLAAGREGDDVVLVLADAAPPPPPPPTPTPPPPLPPTLSATPQEPVALRAAGNVALRLAQHRVPADRLVQALPLADLLAGDAAGLRLNGSLALGVALRCTRLLGPSPLDGDLAAARRRLDAAGPDDLPAARAAAAALAFRAAGALVVSTGSRAVLAGQVAERSAREALLLLVFGSRPAIRDALLGELAGRP